MYTMAENNAKTKFTEVSLTTFISYVIARKFFPRKLQNYTKKTSLANVYSFLD